MAQVRCSVCRELPRSQSQHCPECQGSTWVTIPGRCTHPREEHEAMTGGWLCPDCGESGPY